MRTWNRRRFNDFCHCFGWNCLFCLGLQKHRQKKTVNMKLGKVNKFCEMAAISAWLISSNNFLISSSCWELKKNIQNSAKWFRKLCWQTSESLSGWYQFVPNEVPKNCMMYLQVVASLLHHPTNNASITSLRKKHRYCIWKYLELLLISLLNPVVNLLQVAKAEVYLYQRAVSEADLCVQSMNLSDPRWVQTVEVGLLGLVLCLHDPLGLFSLRFQPVSARLETWQKRAKHTGRTRSNLCIQFSPPTAGERSCFLRACFVHFASRPYDLHFVDLSEISWKLMKQKKSIDLNAKCQPCFFCPLRLQVCLIHLEARLGGHARLQYQPHRPHAASFGVQIFLEIPCGYIGIHVIIGACKSCKPLITKVMHGTLSLWPSASVTQSVTHQPSLGSQVLSGLVSKDSSSSFKRNLKFWSH